VFARAAGGFSWQSLRSQPMDLIFEIISCGCVPSLQAGWGAHRVKFDLIFILLYFVILDSMLASSAFDLIHTLRLIDLLSLILYQFHMSWLYSVLMLPSRCLLRNFSLMDLTLTIQRLPLCLMLLFCLVLLSIVSVECLLRSLNV